MSFALCGSEACSHTSPLVMSWNPTVKDSTYSWKLALLREVKEMENSQIQGDQYFMCKYSWQRSHDHNLQSTEFLWAFLKRPVASGAWLSIASVQVRELLQSSLKWGSRGRRSYKLVFENYSREHLKKPISCGYWLSILKRQGRHRT